MNNTKIKIPPCFNTFQVVLKSMPFLLLCGIIHAQKAPKVAFEIDSAKIKIGEQIRYTIEVEADTAQKVTFPQGQTFLPLEMVEAYPVDTLVNNARYTLIKKYALTQFDSGAYTLPPQKVLINNKAFFTDSLKVLVANVAVDTLKQKMYDIKPIIEVEKSYAGLWKTLLWVLLGLLVAAGLLYWFVFRKKPLTEEEKIALLPPYDRALLELKKLDESKFLIQAEYKEYYSQLTNIVRAYLEEDVHISALESTTDELIDKLELLKDSGNLKIDEDTIQQFKNVLQTADLVKFAKRVPDSSIIQNDRKTIEQIVVKTKEALPEPTEEELLKNEEYLAQLEKKKQKRRLVTTLAASLVLLILIGAGLVWRYGFSYLKDNVFGHPTKELLEGEWVKSDYGYPPVTLETPKVLKREDLDLPVEAQETIQSAQFFGYRSAIGLFTVASSSILLSQPVEVDLNTASESSLQQLEKYGAKNLIIKREEFTTKNGVKGLKTFGSGKFKVPEDNEPVTGKYVIITFGGLGFQQQIVISWLEGDAYAEKIAERILNSLEVRSS